eukprot:scaffold229278_cov31-Prasinocladus_malaysianus.AAC.3
MVRHEEPSPLQTPHSSRLPPGQQTPDPSNSPTQQAPVTSTTVDGPSQTPQASSWPDGQQLPFLSATAPD